MDEHEHISADELLRQFRERLSGLSPEQAIEEMMDAMGAVVQALDRESLLEVREMIRVTRPNSPELIDLIDGNLALRDIQGQT